ncbi:MAG: DsbA family protein, partial [Dongiaceae bacterium]
PLATASVSRAAIVQPLSPSAAQPLSPSAAQPRVSTVAETAAAQTADAGDLAAVIAERRDEIYSDPAAPVAGNPQGDVTVVEFFDYNCPYCRDAASVLAELLESDPGVRLVYKEFPILGPDSVVAAHAALAAHRQGKYVDFHDAVMLGRRSASEETVLRVAAVAGLDIARLKADIQDPAIEAIIQRNLNLARALGISATPSFVIGDRVYAGAAGIEDFRTVVAQVRGQ